MTIDPSELVLLWHRQRQLGFARLAEERDARLRNMTEEESARIFAQLDPLRPYELRPTSGLVEQQRQFMRALRVLQERERIELAEGTQVADERNP